MERRGQSFGGHVSRCRSRPEHGAPLSVDGGGRGDGFAAARHLWSRDPTTSPKERASRMSELMV
jgi:hypothetical protein